MNDIFHLWEIVSNKNDKLVKIYPFRYNYLHIHKFAFFHCSGTAFPVFVLSSGSVTSGQPWSEMLNGKSK